MNCDDLLTQEAINVTGTSVDNEKKDRLVALVASGKSRYYLGVDLTPEQVQRLRPEEIIILHNKYDKVLGALMVKSLGRSIVKLYTKAVSAFVTLDCENDLFDDLIQDPVIVNGISEVSRNLYYKFGSLLAPFSAGLITFQHINFSAIKNGLFQSGDGDGDGGEVFGEPTEPSDSH